MTGRPSVTAVVVTWDSGPDVDRCLAALRTQDHRPLEVLVVDNGSTDGSVGRARRHAADGGDVPLRVLEQGRNTGFCAAVNVGIAASTADAVLLVNPDAVLAPDHVRLLVDALVADPGLGSVQGTLRRGVDEHAAVDSAGHVALRPRLFRNRGEGRPRAALPPPGPGGVVDVFGVTGAAALHRRAMLDDVADGHGRWLDESLFAYFDDVDLDWRARMRGWRAGHVPAAHGVHRRGGRARRRSALVEELNAANRLLVLAKLDDRRALLGALPAVVATTLAKLAWLVLAAPGAALRVPGRVRTGLPGARRERARVRARACRSSAAVSAGFAGLDPVRFVVGWWTRVRPGRGDRGAG